MLTIPRKTLFCYVKQEQTMQHAGIDITDLCFTHGQFYVAGSRFTSEKKLCIIAPGLSKNE